MKCHQLLPRSLSHSSRAVSGVWTHPQTFYKSHLQGPAIHWCQIRYCVYIGMKQASGTGLWTHLRTAACSQTQLAQAGCDHGHNTLLPSSWVRTMPWAQETVLAPTGVPGGCPQLVVAVAHYVPSPGVQGNTVPAYPLGPRGGNHPNLKRETFNTNLEERRGKAYTVHGWYRALPWAHLELGTSPAGSENHTAARPLPQVAMGESEE